MCIRDSYTPSGIGANPGDGSTFSVSTQAYDTPTAVSIIIGGKNSPSTNDWANAEYESEPEPEPETEPEPDTEPEPISNPDINNTIVVNYTESPIFFTNGTYNIFTEFSGVISGTPGTSTMTFASDPNYNIYTEGFGDAVIAYNTTVSSWMVAYTPSGIGANPGDGTTFEVSTQAYDTPTADSITVGGKNSPSTNNWANAEYN